MRPDHILIKSPGVARKHLHQMLQENTAWIEKSLARHEQQARFRLEQAFDRGRLLPVVYSDSVAALSRHEDHFVLPAHYAAEEVLTAFKAFYGQQARQHLPARVQHWSEVMNLYPKQVRLKYLKSRWGSCSARGNINLNYRAMQLPCSAIDSILIHELAHLRYLDHGSAFWQLVTRFCPDYDFQHQLIKKLGPQLI